MNTIDLLANNLAHTKGATAKAADGLDQGTDFSASLQSAGLQSDASTPGLTRLATTQVTAADHATEALTGNSNGQLFSLLQANPRLAPEQAGKHLKDPLAKDQHKHASDAAAIGLPLPGQVPVAALAPTDAASPAKPQPALHAGQAGPLTGQSALAQAHIQDSRVLSDITSGPNHHQTLVDRQQQLSTLIQTHAATAAGTTPASGTTTPVPTWTTAAAIANMPRINHANRHTDHLDLATAGTIAAPMGLHTGATGKVVTLAMPAVLSSPIGSAGWQQELTQQLVHMTQRGTQHMELHLHPRELGPLQISLQLNQNTAQAQFLAAHAQVRDAVQQALPQLREALAGQGIALGQALVGQQQQQSQQQPGNSSRPRSIPSIGGIDSDMSLAQPVHTTVNMPLTTNGGVDLYA